MPELVEWQIRVIEEHAALVAKLVKLTKFLSDESFMKLPQRARSQLYRQCDAMSAYCDVLSERIEDFPKT